MASWPVEASAGRGASREVRQRNRRSTRDLVPIALAFGIMYNPISDPPTAVKTGAVGVLLLMLLWRGRAQLPGLPRAVTVLVLVLVVALVRTSQVFDHLGADASLESALQQALTILALIGFVVTHDRIGRDAYLRGVLVGSASVSAVILVRVGGVSIDRLSQIGEFTNDSYQQIAQAFGTTTIILLGEYWTKNASRRSRLLLRALASLAVAVLLTSLLETRARGEAIALAIAVGVLLVPRISMIVGFVTLAAPQIVVQLVDGIDQPITKLLIASIDSSSLLDRLQFFRDAWDVGTNSILVLLVGGGANHFQAATGNTLGAHPHNLILEMLTSTGIVGVAVVSMVLLAPVARALIRVAASQRVDRTSLSLAIFWLTVMMKSGTITASWNFMMFAPVIISIGRVRLQESDRASKENHVQPAST